MSKLVPVQNSGHNHLDLNLLAAFAEGTLNQRERTALFAHAAECEHCREELRIYTRLRGFAERKASFPFATVAATACAVVCIVLILFHQQEQQKDSRAVLNADRRLNRSDSQKPHSRVTLWNTVQFRRSQFSPGRRSAPDFSTLPGPFTSARLDLQTNFQTALWKLSK